MEHRELRQLIPAHALHALDRDEALVLDAHVVECAECARELGDLREVAGALAFAVPDAAPPPALRERILDAAAPAPAPAAPVRRARWRRRFGWRGMALGLAGSSAAFAALALVLFLRLGDVRDQRDAQSRALAALASNDARLVRLRSSLASLPGGSFVGGGARAVLILPDLPRAARGKTYEAWFIDGRGRPLPAGTFAGGGSTIVPLQGDPSHAAQVAVTLERAGGTPTPQGPVVLSAKLA